MKSKREKKQVVTSLIASIFTFTALLLLAFFWKCEELKNDSRMRVEFAVNYIDNMLERANHAASSVLPLLGRACNQTTVSTLREALLKHPQIRGFSLTDGGSIYCASLTENKRRPYYPELYQENKIRIYHSGENNDFPLILLRTGDNINGSVITSISFYFVADILSIINAVPEVYFHIGHYGLSAQGKQIPIRDPDKNFLHVLSRKFPYELDYHITPVSQLIWVWKAAWLIIPVSLLVALSVWWLTFKYFSRQPSLLDALKVGISSEEFIPYFQPILCAKTRGIIGCEVLIRWSHPLMGIIPPDQFIPLAESSGLIAPMTHQLLNKVKNTLVHLDDVLPSGFHISINISPGHLTRGLQDDCLAFVEALSHRQTVLILEITERVQMPANSEVFSIIKTLRLNHIQFALDDFGTGYANHVYLQKFPVDYIKIDKCFVQLANTDNVTDHIVENVVGLARRLNVAIVAEGIETPEQEYSMIQKGINYLQGYLYSRPLSASEFIQYLRK